MMAITTSSSTRVKPRFLIGHSLRQKMKTSPVLGLIHVRRRAIPARRPRPDGQQNAGRGIGRHPKRSRVHWRRTSASPLFGKSYAKIWRDQEIPLVSAKAAWLSVLASGPAAGSKTVEALRRDKQPHFLRPS